MLFFLNIANIFSEIHETRAFEDKIKTKLFVLTYYDKCDHKCMDIKNGIEQISHDYYKVDIVNDKAAALYMNKIGIINASAYPILFFRGDIYPDPFNSKDIDALLKLE